jgi:hypothetical protein
VWGSGGRDVSGRPGAGGGAGIDSSMRAVTTWVVYAGKVPKEKVIE